MIDKVKYTVSIVLAQAVIGVEVFGFFEIVGAFFWRRSFESMGIGIEPTKWLTLLFVLRAVNIPIN